MRAAEVLDRLRQGWTLEAEVPGGKYYLRNVGLRDRVDRKRSALLVPTRVVVHLVLDKLVESDRRHPLKSYHLTNLGRERLGIPQVDEPVKEPDEDGPHLLAPTIEESPG